DPESKNFNLDLAGGGSRAMHMNWWSAISPDGTMGEPTLADAEIGKQFFEAAVEETIGLIDEVASLPIRQRVDHH
ncbi:MAG: creatininase family protein, partial [Alphaproteobacteria bacterium]|nr:creatininase family protein [Alphaproteobacteria bacterium]